MRRRRLTGRGIVSRLLLLAAGLILPLAGVEVTVQAIEAFRGPMFPGGTRTLSFSSPDSLLGWRHQADFSQRFGWAEHPDGYVTIATNNLGLREDLPTEGAPAAGAVRLLALGDSQTDGLLNNDESWPNVAESVARDRSMPWEVLNAGVTGYRLVHYYTWWHEHGRELEPDFVLLGYYLGNDLFTGADPEEGPSVGDVSSPDIEAGESFAEGLLASLRHRCRLCALASLVGHRFVLDGPTYEELLFVGRSDTEENRRYLAALRACIGCLWQSLEQQWRLAGDEEVYERELERTEALLQTLDNEIRSEGARLVVVLLPTKLQVEPAATERARETAMHLGIPEVDLSFENRLEVDVMRLLETLDIPVVEVKGELEATHIRTGRPVYYDADWHLNVTGARVVGEAVAARLFEVVEPAESE